MKATGKVWKFPQDDINTDQIRRKEYAYLPFNEQAKYCLEILDPQFPSQVSPGDIMVVGRNFGCGSSREHAPQSILRWGIKALIGESFAEIFADNCTAIGLPAVTAEKADIENLMAFVQDDPACGIRIDMERQEVSYGDFTIPIRLAEQSRNALLQGTWDTTSELFSAVDQIKGVAARLPYMNQFRS